MDKILVEEYEIMEDKLVLDCHKIDDGATVFYKEYVDKNEFNYWLHFNRYLQGSSEEIIGTDHTGEPLFHEETWTYTMDEILNGESNWTATEVLQEFVNQNSK